MPPLQRGVPKAGGLKNSINLNANQYYLVLLSKNTIRYAALQKNNGVAKKMSFALAIWMRREFRAPISGAW